MYLPKKAFTLIELLVVIAIIAILAAILFPVFAQAKAAAKKTSELSQIKQVGTGTAIYLADYDDVLSARLRRGCPGHVAGVSRSVPADWISTWTAADVNWASVMWANSTYPYIKSYDMLRSIAGKDRDIAGQPYTAPKKKFFSTNFQMNGLLNGYNATAVNSPSQLILFSQNRGNMNIRGFATANPNLSCPGTSACTFVPSSTSCNGADGTYSEMLVNKTFSQWVHNRGQVVTFADTSAKYRNLNGGVGQKSDYRTMYWTRFAADGSSGTEWQDKNFCHTMLFMPDFDFSTFGAPVEY